MKSFQAYCVSNLNTFISTLIPEWYNTLFLLTTLTLTLFGHSQSNAYEFIGSSWSLGSGESIPYRVNNTLSADVADGINLAALQAGFQSWTDVSCSYMAWRYDGRTSNTGWGVNDQENVVSWRESTWDDSATTLAITSNIFDLRGFIDTDIKYNGFHHNWAVIGQGNARGVDIESVTAHEVGHALGLDHSSVSGATMWPSTGPNDSTPRTLSQDDIDGICALYPSGGERPTATVEPPPQMEGTADFGESCAQEACRTPLFCVSDGVDQFCTQNCEPEVPCPEGHYCAQLSSGSGACVPGEAPMVERVGFNESCGASVLCEAGLLCVSDGEESYCSRPCNQGICDEGFDCAGLQGGGDICVRESDQPAPEFGMPCEEESGRCADELFCLSDPFYVSAVSGEAIPYCSRPCAEGCPRGYRCVELATTGDACQRIPTAGIRVIGDPCWVNPELPFEDPSCGEGLRCVGTQRDPNSQELLDPGYCTTSCNAEACCPQGWGCASVTPFLALCAPDFTDDEGFECTGERPEIERPSTELEGGESTSSTPNEMTNTMNESTKTTDEGGCSTLSIHQRNLSSLSCVLVGLMLCLIAQIRRRICELR